jgi:chemosensory pili system protein ChpA (sensor histidine kinase/response regulator)
MRLQDDIDFTTLTWVKGELDETLKQARMALEAFVEDPDDASQMRFCATYLHQVQGTLRMVELYGAAMVTEEMEQLATALQNRQVGGLDEAYAVLMRGIVQLPDYLERLQGGHKDIPIVLLPLLNDLRAARGEKGLSESALFAPDLSQPLPASAAGPENPVPELELRQQAGALRGHFQIALLRWFKGLEADANLARMIEVCDRLVELVSQEEGRRLFWVAGSVLFGVRSGEIEASQQLKQTVGRVEREIKHLSDAGDTGFRVDPPRELTRNLLYFIAHGRAYSDRLAEIRKVFRLDMFVPTAEEFEEARRSISGHNRALLDTVAGAIREDLLRVKDALDLYLRKSDAQPSELSGQVDVLDRVGDTLGMLGLGVPRRVVMEQRDVVAHVAQGQRPADESTLLDIAGALLYVEATLDDQVQQLGAAPQTQPGSDTLPRAEARRVLEAVIKEAQSNFAQAKQCFVAFVESNWDHAQLQDVQRLLEEVGGAMRVLDVPTAGDLLKAVARFTAVELVQHRRVPNGAQMDTLADALASLEYFIEALRDQRGDRSKILDVARERLETLGYWPIPEHALAPAEDHIPAAAPPAPAPVEAPASEELVLDADVAATPEDPDLQDIGAVEVAPGEDISDLIVGESAQEALQPPREVHELEGFKPAETQATRPPVGSELAGFAVGGEEIDEEIREVFVEEVQEEIDNLRQLLPAWQAHPEDTEALKPIRRVFHTLKGSGRLVGALVLGEFAWKIESMLNRVLDNSIPPRPQVVELVVEARDVLPRLLAALRGEPGQFADIEGLQAAADALAAGQVVEYRPPAAEPEVASEAVPQEAAPTASEEAVPTLEELEDEEHIELSAEHSAALQALLDSHASEPAASSQPQPTSADADEADAMRTEALDSVDVDELSAEELEAASEDLGEVPPVEAEAPATNDVAERSAETLEWSLEEAAADSESRDSATTEESVTAFGPFDVVDPATTEIEEIEFESALPETVEMEVRELEGLESAQEPEDEPLAAPVLIDPDLFEILKAEVAGHLDTVEAYLQRSANGPQLVQEPLLRAVHTINGAFAMTELDVGTELAWPLEGYIKRLMAQSAAPSVVGFEVIEEATQALRSLMIELDQPVPRPQHHTRLAARISGLRDALPEPTAPVLPTEPEELDFVNEGLSPEASTPAVSADDFALSSESSEDREAISESGELSFEFDLDTAEPFDPHARDQSASFEIPETESTTTSPYWTDTESASSLPEVGSALTLDEIGEAAAADDWLAAFEAEVSGEPKRVTGETEQIKAAEEAEPAELEAVGRSDQEDALLLAELPPLESQDATSDLEVEEIELEGFEIPAPESAASDTFEVEEIELQDLEEAESTALVESWAVSAQESLIDVESSGESAEASDLRPDAIEPPAEVGSGFEAASEAEAQSELSAGAAEVTLPEAEAEAEAEAEQASEVEPIAYSDVETDEEPGSAEIEATQIEATQETDKSFGVDESALQEVEEVGQPELVTADEVDVAAEEPTHVASHGRLAIAPDLDPDGPLDLTDVDADLLDVFLEEGVDILDHSDSLLGRLREAPDDSELIIGLQRDLHTLKGGARMAGLNPIGDLAHASESLLEAVAAGGRDLGSSGIEVLERAYDRLHSLVSRVGERRAIAMPVNLLAAVEALLRGEALPTVGESAAEAEPQLEAVAESAPSTPAPPPIRFIPTETALDEEETVTRAPQEQIRIRADLLDRLVNYAGEVAIYRARLEQQLGAFRGNLGELDQTTTRMREQLRKLEIETEAQILSRYQRQQDEGDAEFDPLELDRFSTLQQLSRALSESAADVVNLQHSLEDLTRQYETLLLQQSRVSSDLQEGLMRTRMVPFDSLVPRLRRILRQTAGELGKQAQLKVEGAQGEMDRNVLDRMTAPLEHMLRNALAHGLESPDERASAGKAPEGTIRILVAREASEVLIRVSDDGRGLDREAIRRKAIERGLLKADVQLSDRELYGFILESGFSTATTVSKIAGRGVGMDVVYSEIRQLGGSLHIESERGRGTEFVIRLPFTLAVTQAVFVKQGDTSYAIPITSVQGVSRIDRAELDKQLASGAPSFSYAGEDYTIHDLGLLLGQPAAKAADSLQVPILLARSGDQRAAICVDTVLGSREIVVKPTGPQVSSIPGIFGATIMGDGRVVVILDVAPLVRRAAAIEHVEVHEDLSDKRVVPLVMVVDDSITMRKVTGRVLERHNFEVLTAKDGVDAIEKLAERIPDVMLLDIEMPRMDGYELATHMKNDPRLRGVPIIMITSRTGDKHRQRAFEIGVDRYLGKPYQEADLMRNVQEILQVRRERSH